VSLRNQLVLTKSEQTEFKVKLSSVDLLTFSSTDQKLTVDEMVEKMSLKDAGVCPTAGCAPRLESFYA
jgi:hypothetical protein